MAPFFAALLAGCAADSRPRVVSAAGEPLIKKQGPVEAGLYTQFQQAAETAYPTDIADPPGPDIQRRFMRSGFELINVTCNAYIEGKADRQRTLNVWRDAFAPITTLATGAVALAHKGDTIDSDGLTALALLTSATNSGFEIYEQRYLFGAKNVDNVRRLVLRAQLEHANAALAMTDDELNYGAAVRYLVENQMVCSPGAILELVSKAIDTGKITAVSGNTAAPAAAGAGAGAAGGGGAAPAAGGAAPAPAPSPAAVSPMFNPIELKVGL